MNLQEAEKLAREIVALVRPLCIRCEVAGSVRRKKIDDIKDVEIVAIPDSKQLFALRDVVNTHWGQPSAGAFPSKYTRIRTHVNIDFFWCSTETFGLNFFIRTGDAEYAKRGLAYWKKVSTGGYAKEARLYTAKGELVPTPEEEDVFTAMGAKFLAPEKRVRA
jgi:DNA polymerase/3'-5' exonuclease PolX